MTLGEEIIKTLRGSPAGSHIPERRVARSMAMTLGRTLGGQVLDQTDHISGRTYRFFHPVRSGDEGQWGILLHVLVSTSGPYATHTFRQTLAPDRWWGSTVRISRSGFGPEDAETLERLRTFYREQGLTEVDVFTQSTALPEDLIPARPRTELPSLYDLLFHS